jgi:hypothetical protein
MGISPDRERHLASFNDSGLYKGRVTGQVLDSGMQNDGWSIKMHARHSTPQADEDKGREISDRTPQDENLAIPVHHADDPKD